MYSSFSSVVSFTTSGFSHFLKYVKLSQIISKAESHLKSDTQIQLKKNSYFISQSSQMRILIINAMTNFKLITQKIDERK